MYNRACGGRRLISSPPSCWRRKKRRGPPGRRWWSRKGTDRKRNWQLNICGTSVCAPEGLIFILGLPISPGTRIILARRICSRVLFSIQKYATDEIASLYPVLNNRSPSPPPELTSAFTKCTWSDRRVPPARPAGVMH